MSSKRFDFQDIEEFDFSEELSSARHFSAEKNLFLHVLDEKNVWFELERSRIIADLNKKGYYPLKLELEFLTERDHRLYLYFAKEKILHMRLRISHFKLHRHPLMPVVKLLFIDWLQTRHVLRKEGTHRLFPGQDVPGLGIFNRIDTFLRRMTELTHAVGGFNMPEYFHDALLFHRAFRFYDPEREGKFRALLRDLRVQGARAISQGLSNGIITDEQNNRVEWKSGEMILFMDKRYSEKIFDPYYFKVMEKSMKKSRFKMHDHP